MSFSLVITEKPVCFFMAGFVAGACFELSWKKIKVEKLSAKLTERSTVNS